MFLAPPGRRRHRPPRAESVSRMAERALSAPRRVVRPGLPSPPTRGANASEVLPGIVCLAQPPRPAVETASSPVPTPLRPLEMRESRVAWAPPPGRAPIETDGRRRSDGARRTDGELVRWHFMTTWRRVCRRFRQTRLGVSRMESAGRDAGHHAELEGEENLAKPPPSRWVARRRSPRREAGCGGVDRSQVISTCFLRTRGVR